jgi:RNA polymerase sigma-70 factor (ECF subfamily)
MTDLAPPIRICDITTQWSSVLRAHHGPEVERTASRHRLLDRYRGAVARYLRAAVRDGNTADELAQEFCLRFLRGDFHHVEPGRGRFRDYLKTVLCRLVARHHGQARPQPLPADVPDGAEAPPAPDSDDGGFERSWRTELMARAWAALEQLQVSTGRPAYTVLRLRVDRPDLSADGMAEELTARLGKPVSAVAARQLLHRARERYAELLLDEVVHGLAEPTDESLVQELIDLELLGYCRPALARYGFGKKDA